MRHVALLLMVAGLAIGCDRSDEGSGGSNEDDAAPAETAENAQRTTDPDGVNAPAERKLTSLVIDGEERSLVEGSVITLTLRDANAVAGHAGVNRYDATPEVSDDGRLVWPPIVTTKMAGPPELMAQEDAFLAALARTDRMLVEKDRLILENEDASVRLVFR